MNKFVAVLALGLGLCLSGRASAQENGFTYPAIVPVSATNVASQPAKAVAPAQTGCCKCCTPNSCRDAKASCCGTSCNNAPCKPCCFDKFKKWCCYRAVPCGCNCYCCGNCNPHVWEFFPPGPCGCGYGCAGGACATGGCAGGACPAGGCAQPH
jgi:hypothetical protein